jgi:DNA-binding response OmpR family regulator
MMECRKKVLVVDDEELARDFLQFFLAKKFDVYTCGNVDSFYSTINKIDFDLILMDISLRDRKDGLELTKELRNSPKYKNIPVFILTALNTTKVRNSSIDAGADQFLTKPIDARTVMQLINTTLVN